MVFLQDSIPSAGADWDPWSAGGDWGEQDGPMG